MTNKILMAIAVVVLFVVGIFVGRWTEKPTLDDLAERNRALARQDTVRLVELEDLRTAHIRLGYDFNNAEEAWTFVNDSLNDVANALKRQAEKDGRTIETLATANVVLRDSVDALVGNISVTDSMITAELYSYKKYQDGSIGYEGYVTVWTPLDDEPYGSAGLSFDIQMTPTVLISRDEDSGLASCALSFGDMPVYVDELNCVNNWDVNLPVRDKVNWPTVGVTAGAIGLIAVLLAVAL